MSGDVIRVRSAAVSCGRIIQICDHKQQRLQQQVRKVEAERVRTRGGWLKRGEGRNVGQQGVIICLSAIYLTWERERERKREREREITGMYDVFWPIFMHPVMFCDLHTTSSKYTSQFDTDIRAASEWVHVHFKNGCTVLSSECHCSMLMLYVNIRTSQLNMCAVKIWGGI